MIILSVPEEMLVTLEGTQFKSIIIILSFLNGHLFQVAEMMLHQQIGLANRQN